MNKTLNSIEALRIFAALIVVLAHSGDIPRGKFISRRYRRRYIFCHQRIRHVFKRK